MFLDKENSNINRLLVKGVVVFASGIIFGYYADLELILSLLVLGGLFLFWALIYFFYQTNCKPVVCVLIFVLGIIWCNWFDAQSLVLKRWENKKVTITGHVAAINNYHNQIILKLDQINGQKLKQQPPILVKQNLKYGARYSWGDKVSFQGYLLPTLPQTNPGGFSEKEYWRTKGINFKLYAGKKGKLISKDRGFQDFLHKIRQNIYKKVTGLIPEEESGIVLGLILGDKSLIDNDFYTAVQKLGIAHIFAVSGLHVGFLVVLYFLVINFFNIRNNHNLVLFVVLIILTLYSLITGLTPSVVRASVMAFLALLSQRWLKFKDFYTLLATAALIILIFNPLNLFAIGFQLSFITTWGLVYFFPVATRILSWLPPKMGKVLAVPLAAQMAALPVIVYHFNLVSFWAPLMNVLIVPLIGILVPLLFVAVTLAVVWVKLAEPFLYLAAGIIFTLQFLIGKFIEFFTTGHIYMAKPNLGAIFLYYLLLIGCKENKYLNSKLSLNTKTYVSIILMIFLLLITLPGKNPLRVTFLDIGQGDSTVVQTPLHQFIVIDGGPSNNTTVRYLQYQGVNKLALMVLSHPDQDHIQGLYKVIKDIPTRVLLVPPDVENTPALQKLKNLATQRGTKIIEGKAGLQLKMAGEIYWKVIWPGAEAKNFDVNEASLVLQCSYGQQDILFTGDIDKGILKRILSEFNDNDIEIVKIPHHGSKGSYFPGFYTRLQPRLAVISVGRNNRYGHPHGVVIKALQKNEINIFRTDQQGAVLLELDGSNIKVETMLKEVIN